MPSPGGRFERWVVPVLLAAAMTGLNALKPPCIEGQVANKPNTSAPDCSVVSHTRNGSSVVDDMVPSCAETSGATPCWQLVPGQGTCTGQTMQINNDPNAPPATSQDATVACALCVPGVSAPERGCP